MYYFGNLGTILVETNICNESTLALIGSCVKILI